MDLLDIVRACLRRWYVFVPIMGLTVWLAMGQYKTAQPQYTASTSIIVVPSRDLIVGRQAQGEGGEPVVTPFNGNNGSSTLAGLLRSALNTGTVREELLPEGGVAIDAVRDTEEDSSLVTVTVTAGSEQRASAAVEAVNANANAVLAAIQTTAGAPGNQLFVTAPGGPSDAPFEDYPDRIRAVVGLGLAGALAAVVLSVVVQALARGRRGKAGKQRAKLPQPQPQPPKSPRRSATRSDTAPLGGSTAPSSEIDVRGSRVGSRR